MRAGQGSGQRVRAHTGVGWPWLAVLVGVALLRTGCSADPSGVGSAGPDASAPSGGASAAGATGDDPASGGDPAAQAVGGGPEEGSVGGSGPVGAGGSPLGPSGGAGPLPTGGTGVLPAGGTGGAVDDVCPVGQNLCGTVCADLQSDPNHCGACNNACAAGQLCSAGQCQTSCAAGETLCGQSCADLSTSAAHCGQCNQACLPGQSCVGGVCTCASGTVLCAGACVDTNVDPLNCGSCGTVCAAGETCTQGACGCPEGQQLCGGVCVDTDESQAHCGSCNHACAAGQFCNLGQCESLDCPPGQVDCDGTCTDVLTDFANCGGCGEVCVGECCDGVCTQVMVDPNNCGACGATCYPPGSCELGSCICPAGQAYCNGDCVNVRDDPDNCGACGAVCVGGLPCEWGACVCPDGLVYCDDACRPMSECVTSAFGGPTDITTEPPADWSGGDVCPGTEVFESTATWFTLGGALPHCSYPPEGLPEYYAAINEEDYAESAACGACVRVYHPSSAKTLDVMLADECPAAANPEWCYPGSHHIDLNQEAFQHFADLSVGVLDVQWQYVECSFTSNMEYAFKDGTSTYWTAITFRNHNLPLVSVRYANASGIVRTLSRVDYNYWLDSQGFGIGPYELEIADAAGNVLVDTVPPITGEIPSVVFEEMNGNVGGCSGTGAGL